MGQPAGGGKPNRANVYGLISDAQRRQIRIDAYTHDIITVSQSHHEIHEGDYFYVSGFTTGLTDTEQIQFHVITPNSTKEAHITFEVEGTGITAIYIYESASSAVGGTTATPINSNRNSTNASLVTVIQDGVSTTTGNIIDAIYLGANVDKKTVSGGGVSREDELILKRNTRYIYRLISKSTGNNITYKGAWYMSSPKD